jgi:hypothetical protein
MRGTRNKNLSNRVLLLADAYIGQRPSLGASMQKICTAIVASTILISPAFAHDHDHERWNDNDHRHHFHGAPGPIAGAGLPVLAIGYGVYWLVRRRRKANQNGPDAR